MTRTATAASATRTTYERTVVVRAMARAGRNPHLKGHIHEILVKDARNLGQLFGGQQTELTRSTTAKCVDLVTTEGGKVVERLQLKDTLSPSGVSKLVKQVASGKYRSARLVGTEETAQLANAALEKAGLAKRVTSSGISSRTTTTLAQSAGAAGSGTLLGAVGKAARCGGAAGAAIGAGVEAIGAAKDLYDGKVTTGEAALRVAKGGAKGGIAGALSGAAATAAGAGTAAGAAVLGLEAGLLLTSATVALPIVAAVATGWLATKAWDRWVK